MIRGGRILIIGVYSSFGAPNHTINGDKFGFALKVLRILFKDILQLYGSRLSYDTYKSLFLFERMLPYLKYRNDGGNHFVSKKTI